MIFVFWMLSFKSTFSLPSFTFIKKLFNYFLLSAIRVVSSAWPLALDIEGQETQVRSGGRALERVPWEGLPETIQPLFGETKNWVYCLLRWREVLPWWRFAAFQNARAKRGVYEVLESGLMWALSEVVWSLLEKGHDASISDCEDRVLTWGFQRVLKSNSLLMLSIEILSIFKLACTVYLPEQKLLGVVKSCRWRWGNCNVQASEDSKWWGCWWLQISDLISFSLSFFFFKFIHLFLAVLNLWCF